jgi:hypothetical protein
MKKFAQRHAVSASLLVIAAAVFAFTFVASPVFAQADGQRLDAPAAAPSAASAPTAKAILAMAESDYYVLQGQGVKAFQCDIQPNWAKLITDPAKLKLVRPIEYTAVIDEQGGVQVSPFRADKAAIDPSLDQIVGGVQQLISGFFQTWNPLVFSGVFSPAQDGGLGFSSQADGYHFTQATGGTNVDMTLTKDALVTEMKVTTADSVIVMMPTYVPTNGGLMLLTGLNNDINNGTQKVDLQIAYQPAEGFQLPSTVSYQVTLPTQVVDIEMSLSDYQVVKR